MPLFDQQDWGTQPFPNPWMPAQPATPPPAGTSGGGNTLSPYGTTLGSPPAPPAPPIPTTPTAAPPMAPPAPLMPMMPPVMPDISMPRIPPPDPALAAMPPMIDQTMTANTTGGPVTQQPARADVGAQLYRLGKQQPGQTNPFDSFGTRPESVDPFSLLPQQEPEQPDPRMLRAQQPGPMGPMRQGPQGPSDRFPRLTRLMGRPVVPRPRPSPASRRY
jgi:hypothetical protein